MSIPNPAQPVPRSCKAVAVQGLRAGMPVQRQDWVVRELPVALEFNGVAHAVMMATPEDLEDFAYGFALSEGIVQQAGQIYGVEIDVGQQCCTVQLEIAGACFARLKEMRRVLAGRTGCGLCGTESLAHAVRLPEPVRSQVLFSARAVSQAMEAMRERQELLALTGSTHAAAWCTPAGDICLVREDVGRHNALDKLIGAMARTGAPLDGGFIAISSRASYEMVQKTAHAGVGLLAAVSGVTSLAIEVAEACGLTLLGFVRGQDCNVYTHAQRFIWETVPCKTAT
ncbi:formate dehydrogenase accessory sulfurtransferase FdhD [Alicycliphilus denitrificans]|uniref:formate dehydrogenase accessory sulfurtransferase FdhD n=1 Tax=Alicycliphilus denitrificans TaxID=179636 RepID=UPI00384AB553